MTQPLRILGVAGSLRAGSFNRALLHAAVDLAPGRMAIEAFDLAVVPLYNGDVEAVGDPRGSPHSRRRSAQPTGCCSRRPSTTTACPE